MSWYQYFLLTPYQSNKNVKQTKCQNLKISYCSFLKKIQQTKTKFETMSNLITLTIWIKS